jgi:hypothetical protein
MCNLMRIFVCRFFGRHLIPVFFRKVEENPFHIARLLAAMKAGVSILASSRADKFHLV